MSWGESVAARAAPTAPWFGTVGPVVTVADVVAVLLAGLVAGALGLAVAVAGRRGRPGGRARRPRGGPAPPPAGALDRRGPARAARRRGGLDRWSCWSPTRRRRRSPCWRWPCWSWRTRSSTARRTCSGVPDGSGVASSVVGTGPTARRLALTLIARPEFGLAPGRVRRHRRPRHPGAGARPAAAAARPRGVAAPDHGRGPGRHGRVRAVPARPARPRPPPSRGAWPPPPTSSPSRPAPRRRGARPSPPRARRRHRRRAPLPARHLGTGPGRASG